jgi:beta-carotene hydroxylase
MVAWPTVGLAVFAVLLWCAGAKLFVFGWWLGGVATMTVATYLAFTPMHDASHFAAARLGWVNAIIGRICALAFFAPFVAFRYVHLEHHKHTNDAQRDPDTWSARTPRLFLPLRWVTQDLHYYWVYGRAGRPLAERIEAASIFGGLVIVAAALVTTGHPWFLGAWILSGRLALTVLAFSFDFWPHHPHDVTHAQNRYLTTTVRPGFVLQVLLLNQNLHLMHHLHPGVPFYRYGPMWRAEEAELRQLGARVE